MEIMPQNAFERLFAICTVLFGMVAFSSCISSITGYMMQLRQYNRVEREQEQKLRTFFRDHHVSFGVSQQIWNFLKAQRMNHRTRLMEDGVELLRLIPDVLRLELHAELFVPTLMEHPFFFQLAIREEATIQYICSVSLKQDTIRAGHVHFEKGSEAHDMLFVCAGRMFYSLLELRADIEKEKIGNAGFHLSANITKTKSHTLQTNPGHHYLEEGAWISEAGLWIPDWRHCGWLLAIANAELIFINFDSFHEYFARHSAKSCLAVRRYGAYFNNLAYEIGVWNHFGITDLPAEFEKLEEMATKSFAKLHSLEGTKLQKHEGVGMFHLLGREFNHMETRLLSTVDRSHPGGRCEV